MQPVKRAANMSTFVDFLVCEQKNALIVGKSVEKVSKWDGLVGAIGDSVLRSIINVKYVYNLHQKPTPRAVFVVKDEIEGTRLAVDLEGSCGSDVRIFKPENAHRPDSMRNSDILILEENVAVELLTRKKLCLDNCKHFVSWYLGSGRTVGVMIVLSIFLEKKPPSGVLILTDAQNAKMGKAAMKNLGPQADAFIIFLPLTIEGKSDVRLPLLKNRYKTKYNFEKSVILCKDRVGARQVAKELNGISLKEGGSEDWVKRADFSELKTMRLCLIVKDLEYVDFRLFEALVNYDVTSSIWGLSKLGHKEGYMFRSLFLQDLPRLEFNN